MNEEKAEGAETPPSPPEDVRADAEGVTEGGYAYTVVREPDAPQTPTSDTEAPSEAEPRKRSRAGLLAALVVVAALFGAIGGAVAMWLIGGTSDGATRAGADTASVINAFSQGQGVEVTRYELELPPTFPDVPTYDGAEIVSSLEQFNGDDAGFLAVYDTTDSRDDVAAWYREKLSEDPWQVDAGQDGADSALLRFTRIDDANISGVVLIGESTEREITTILVSAEVIAGGGGERPEYSPGVSKPLPEGFPSDEVPAYPDAVVIETAFERQAGSDGYAISLITTDDADTVMQFYEDAFNDNGWEVSEGDVSQVTMEDPQAITFLGGDPETSGSVTTGVFSRDEDYTRIDLQVRTSN